MSNCPHAIFDHKFTFEPQKDGTTVLVQELWCSTCGEQMHWVGVGPTLRARFEPRTELEARLNKPQGFERYWIETTVPIDERVPEHLPLGIAHDRWFMAPECAQGLADAGDQPAFKAGVPARYVRCPSCIPGATLDREPEEHLGGAIRTDALVVVDEGVATAASVVPLAPEEREEGQPVAAAAAIALPPDPDDEPPEAPSGEAITRQRPTRARGGRS